MLKSKFIFPYLRLNYCTDFYEIFHEDISIRKEGHRTLYGDNRYSRVEKLVAYKYRNDIYTLYMKSYTVWYKTFILLLFHSHS